MAKVQVLGTGCSKCGYLLKNAQAAASERQAGDVVEKVDDIMQVLEFNPSALPALYGIGTGGPVLVFALLLVFGKQSFSAFFKKVTNAETWLRRITGGSILAVGFHITVQQIYLS